jgi:hypothetical protein
MHINRRTNWMRKGVCAVALIVSGVVFLPASAQIFKYRHSLTQENLDSKNFSLNLMQARPLRAEVTISAPTDVTLFQKVPDRLNLVSAMELQANNICIIRTDGAIFGKVTLVASRTPYPIAAGTEYEIPPNMPVSLAPGNYILLSSVPNTSVRLSSPTATYPVGNKFEALSSTIVRLTRTTKGIISVGSKIMFDPWMDPRLPATSSNSLDVVRNTTVPLELKDGRTTISDPTWVLRVPYRHKTISLNSIPIRYRGRRVLADTVFAYGTVSPSFSLALSYGQTYGYSVITTRGKIDRSLTVSVFAGPSSAEFKKATVKKPDEVKKDRTGLVLSYGVSLVAAQNGFGFLIAVGADKALGKYGDIWVYNNKLWLGFGISASFPK